MSSGCWMIKLLIQETDKDSSSKAFIFYGFNMTAAVLGFLFAGLATAVAWSVREQLPTRRRDQVFLVINIYTNSLVTLSLSDIQIETVGLRRRIKPVYCIDHKHSLSTSTNLNHTPKLIEN